MDDDTDPVTIALREYALLLRAIDARAQRRGDRPVKVYLAGPMRGLPDLNRAAFLDAAELLRASGHEVVHPAEHNIANGPDVRTAVAWGLAQVCWCDVIVVLSGWEDSRRTAAEIACAYPLDLPWYPLCHYVGR